MASLPEPTDGWSIERASHGGGGISGFLVRTRTDERLMVKVARTAAGQASLDRAAGAQRTIAEIEALGSWRARLPTVMSDGHAGDWRFVVETALPGRPLALPAPDDPGWPVALEAALGAIEGLHGRTASNIRRSIDARGGWTSASRPWARSDRRWLGMTRGWTERWRPASSGSRPSSVSWSAQASLSAGWIHGDYWSANILVDEAGGVSGIVDWDSAEPDELAAHDVFHLVLYARKLRRREALGAVVADLLGGSAFDAHELAALERAGPPGFGIRTTALLYWLQFVESNLRRQPGLATSERWLAANVGAVVPWL